MLRRRLYSIIVQQRWSIPNSNLTFDTTLTARSLLFQCFSTEPRQIELEEGKDSVYVALQVQEGRKKSRRRKIKLTDDEIGSISEKLKQKEAEILIHSAEKDWRRCYNLLSETFHLPPSISVRKLTFECVLKCLGGNFREEEASKVLEAMKIRGVEISTAAYSHVLGAYSRSSSVNKSLEVFDEIVASGLKPTLPCYNFLFSTFGRANRPDLIAEYYSKLRCSLITPTIVTFTTLLGAYGRCGEWKSCNEVMRDMRLRKFIPDERCFNSLLFAFSHNGMHEKAIQTLHQMRVLGLQPNERSFAAVIESCRKGLRWREACSVVREIQSNAPYLISCCRMAFQICRAAKEESAAQDILALASAVRGAK